MTLSKEQLWLVDVFQTYCKKNHLPNESAERLLNPPFNHTITDSHHSNGRIRLIWMGNNGYSHTQDLSLS